MTQPSKPLDDLSQPIDKLRAAIGWLDIKKREEAVRALVEAEIVEARIEELKFWVRVLDEKDKYFFRSINADKLQATLKDRIKHLKGEALKQPNQSNQDREV